MSTFTLPNTQITVKLCDDLTREQLLEFPAFKIWLSRLQTSLALQHTNPSHAFHSSPYALRALTIQSLDRFGHTRIGFLKLTASITNRASESLPGAVFLRGASVGMLVVLQPDDVPLGSEAEKYVLLTVQPRVAAGSLEMVELPAGMVDDGTFVGSAAKEIKEELGLDIPEDELVNLTELAIPAAGDEGLPRAMYPSAGGCDECIPLFLHEKRVPRATLSEWTGRLTGLRDEGEKITLKLVRREDLWWQGARDAKALGALALWEGLKRNGKL
ncbi:Nudix hydrolase 14-like protein [Lachnellula willkommii]|uniref:Nudix hydrolase 14-like protein n=1 Tax=Lachnellula willkommii TaxID=215461 RepID=A0A559MAS4_9HELO|nr:Nudix hydrolase 14-like protein [Lachnellula willkommii]